ncbi:Uncharacterized protein OBRU01_06475 [Operophtera brumata]|uniref:Adenylate kinase n=1 Tax=Operophtera brumata TaxID=104452 RepID=A0A0L7LLM6_OPEBR|nr:Uncharacterized protein OBRU01_06475 [Operophtera brumata]
MLVAVNGERNPEEVYKDFRAAVLQILGSTDEQSNGVSGIPGEIVGIERAPEREDSGAPEIDRERRGADRLEIERGREAVVPNLPKPVIPLVSTIPVPMPPIHTERIESPKVPRRALWCSGSATRQRCANEPWCSGKAGHISGTTTSPVVLWFSNKAALCQRAVLQRQGWTHFRYHDEPCGALVQQQGSVVPTSRGAAARLDTFQVPRRVLWCSGSATWQRCANEPCCSGKVGHISGTTTSPVVLWFSNKAALCQRAVLQWQGWTHFRYHDESCGALGGGRAGQQQGIAVPTTRGAAARLDTFQVPRRVLWCSGSATRQRCANEPWCSGKAGLISDTTARPLVLWVVGGPGSNKAALCQRAVVQRQGWTHFIVGQRLRTLADAGGGPASDGALARAAISAGELAPRTLVLALVRGALADVSRTGHGLVLDGYPRDLDQMEQFQNEVDGDTESADVQSEFSRLILEEMEKAELIAAIPARPGANTGELHCYLEVDGDTESADVQSDFSRLILEEMEKAELIAAIPARPGATTGELAPRTLVLQLVRGALVDVSRTCHGLVLDGYPRDLDQMEQFQNKVKPVINNVTKIPSVSQMTHDDVRRLYAQSTGDIALNTHI